MPAPWQERTKIHFTPHRKHLSNTKFNRLMVLRKIKTSDNNAKPYIVCSKTEKRFAEALVHGIML